MLLDRGKTRKRAVVDAPPPGAVIQGASNWEGLQDDVEARPDDLENIGFVEALKPIPPAYGMVRGSVRIADSDIRSVINIVTKFRWVSRSRLAGSTLEGNEEVIVPEPEVNRSSRPPSYASHTETLVA
jgi:hypothetical protein